MLFKVVCTSIDNIIPVDSGAWRGMSEKEHTKYCNGLTVNKIYEVMYVHIWHGKAYYEMSNDYRDNVNYDKSYFKFLVDVREELINDIIHR